jgi:cytochrome c-type biogenesis protein CcmE
MKRRDRTLILIIVSGLILVAASVFVAIAMKKTVSFFYTPQDIAHNPPVIGANVRLGGLVKADSIKRGANGKINFVVTDGIAQVTVEFVGITPDLFRENQGVIAEGQFISTSEFKARQILAKHDENYIPKEVASKLKESGQWKDPVSNAKYEGGRK